MPISCSNPQAHNSVLPVFKMLNITNLLDNNEVYVLKHANIYVLVFLFIVVAFRGR